MTKQISNKSSYAWHKYWVYKDPDFIQEIKALPKRTLSHELFDEYARIAKQFDIRESDVDYAHEWPYENYNPEDIASTGLGYLLKFNKHGFVVNLDYNITQKQFQHLWKQLQFYKSNIGIVKSKAKPPERTKLIYAFYKARKKYSVPEIYQQILSGSLEGFSGPSDKLPDYMDEDKLEAYYNKYKPNPS